MHTTSSSIRSIILATIFVLVLAGCASKKTPATITPLKWSLVDTQKLSIEEPLNYPGLQAALDSSVQYLKSKPATQPLATIKEQEIEAGQLLNSLTEFSKFLSSKPSTSREILKYLGDNFCAYEADHTKLFTGYYRATLNGSLKPTSRYRFPVYGEPKDLVTLRTSDFAVLKQIPGIPAQVRGRLKDRQLVPYWSRAEIDSVQNKLRPQAQVLAWVDDQIELFFMHIQGSGKILLPNNKYIELGYSNSNGWPYRAVGAYLISQGHIKAEDMSKPAIVNFLRANPTLANEVLNYNPSFVFFQPKPKGTYGALNQPLVAGHSLASDHQVYPAGAPMIVEVKNSKDVPDIKRLMFNQDIGGAIKGPGRFDLFCGEGNDAEWLAGHLKNRGRLTLLVPRDSFKGSCPK